MTTYIGEIPIYYISSFDTDHGLKGVEEIPFLGQDAIPYLSEQGIKIREFKMTGTLLQDTGVIPDIDDMAEDLLALRNRGAHFNYIHDFQNRSGWVGIKDANSDKNAESLVTRPYMLSGKFLPKSLYQTRMHSYPAIRPNDFSFTLGVDDCDNYIAIPIGATYLGGDGSTISRTSKDGTITLVKATSDSDITWDIGEADRLNGECKVYDMMSENLLKNDDFELWSDGLTLNEWTHSSVLSDRRSSPKYTGSYSARLGATVNPGEIYQSIDDYASYRGKTVTAGIWMYAVGSPGGRIKITDGVGSSTSSYHTGSSLWEWLSISRDIDNSASELTLHILVENFELIHVDGSILIEGSTCPITPVLDTYGIQVYGREKEFIGSMIIENGLYRMMINPSTDHITLYYWDGSAYICISAFSAGTFTRTTILESTPDKIRIKLDSGVEIEIRRGHPPMIDTDTIDLIAISLTPADQSTTTENYLVLGTSIYICSDESFSLVNSTKNCDDGKKWIFYETVSATAEDIAHQCMVDARQTRELIQR